MQTQGRTDRDGFAVNLGRWVNRAARDLARAGDAALRPVGLRYSQVPVLALLQSGCSLTQTDLASATGIEQPSMAELLGRMRRDGLIESTRNPRDGRSQVISLTPAACQVLDDAHQRITAMEGRALRGFTADEVTTLTGLLMRLSHNLHDSASRETRNA